MSSLAGLEVDLDDEELLELEKNTQSHTVSPQIETPIKQESQLPAVNENVEAISRSCIALLNDMCLPPSRKNSGVYTVCNNLLLIQHSTAVEYAKQHDNGLVPFDAFKDNMLDVAMGIHNDGVIKSFSNYVSVLGSLEGKNDRLIGGGFHDRVSVLASIITFVVRSNYQVSEWENTPYFYVLAEETFHKYNQYQNSISKLNIPDGEKVGFSQWLGLYFPKEIMHAWFSSMKHGPQPSL